MYTSEVSRKKNVHTNASVSATSRVVGHSSNPHLGLSRFTDNVGTSGSLPPLHGCESSYNSIRTTAPGSQLPTTTHAAVMAASRDRGERTRHIVMDPLAALRRCIQYLCSHPEVYGDDVRGLLDREVMHVVRLKASEISLSYGERPFLMDSLESATVRKAACRLQGLPPLSNNTNAMSLDHGNLPGSVYAGDLFGYGNISFLPASSIGFNALVQQSRSEGAVSMQERDFHRSNERKTMSADFSTSAPPPLSETPLDEIIQWGGTLPPSSVSPSYPHPSTPSFDVKTEKKHNVDLAASEGIMRDGDGAHQEKKINPVPSLPSGDASGWRQALNTHRLDDVFKSNNHTQQDLPVALPNSFRAGESAVVMDQQGYEVTYLRTQLQQLEAAFNSKCVRMHELEKENQQLTEEMKNVEGARAQWAAQNHIMQGQLEVLRRELDGWKDRASDAVAAATKQSKRQNQHAKQIASTQLSEAKLEIARLNQLWRETERGLQEARRSFENTEREAVVAHNHLADVFHYLERLERRVARRDAYISLCERRHQSLEEKYEKLRWAYEELGTLEGRYSYVDYILTTKPLWSVYMFMRISRRLGDYVALENAAEVQKRLISMMGMPNPTSTISEGATGPFDSLKPLYGLIFSRTVHGGRLVAELYDVRLIFRTLVDEVTAEIQRRGRPKQLRTNLHGSVGCRVIRWHERYSVDFLGSENSDPDNGDMNRKFLPLMTLASVLLPLRSRTGNLMIQVNSDNPTSPTGGESGDAATEHEVSPEEEAAQRLLSTIPNKHRYDEATIRFVLRSFWKERVGDFSRQMDARLKEFRAEWELEKKCRRRLSDRAGSHLSERLSTAGSNENLLDVKSVDEEDSIVIQTFLAALVDFATRFSAKQAASTTVESIKSVSPPNKATLLSVRGVLIGKSPLTKSPGKSLPNAAPPTKKTAFDSLWDCGRLFFASVLQPVTVDASKKPQVSPSRDPPISEEVTALAEDTREILAALYYYTLEYKDMDPDFRLFYLVAHQFIPEMVAVNFFVGVEALQRECATLIESRLQCLWSNKAAAGSGSESAQPHNPPAVSKEVEDPLMALTRAVDIMDEALLDGEGEDIEPDSDGEGYGTILPLHPKVGTQQRPATASSASEGKLPEEKQEEGAGEEKKASNQTVSQRECEVQLMHNVRSYLRQRRPSMQGKEIDGDHGPDKETNDTLEAFDDSAKNSSGSRMPVPLYGAGMQEWTALEAQVVNSIGPHTALLDAFRQYCGEKRRNPGRKQKGRGKSDKELDYLRIHRAERARRHERTKHLSATRGLLCIEDVLKLVERHCLATYALSCCGTARFSLIRSILNSNSATNPDVEPEIDPYAIVGHIPLTGLLLQRLRFALSLDQPANLIRSSSLFAVDPVTKSNSHFYDAYLTIVLDVFEQQQAFLMHSVLRSCAVRHEHYAAEGTEDCDGSIPISWLKRGLTAALATVRGTPLHAHAVLDHLLHYDELLRLEDDVRLEQFTDAPLLLNVPPGHKRRSSMLDGSSDVSDASDLTAIDGDEGAGGWNLHEEADTCSLLHLALAIRMSYIIWGQVSAPTAEALISRIVKYSVPVCGCDVVQEKDYPATSSRPVNKQSVVLKGISEWNVFDQSTRQHYTRILLRLQHGHNGAENPLRRMLSVLLAEAQPSLSILSSYNAARAAVEGVSGTLDIGALYPDVKNVWTTRKVLEDGQKLMEEMISAQGSPDAVKGLPMSGKGKKSRRLSLTRKTLPAKQIDQETEGTKEEVDRFPDYGLLSLVRALGFVLPSSTDVLGAGPATTTTRKAKNSKRSNRSPAVKNSPTSEAMLSTALQEEYTQGLVVELQAFAARVAVLLSPHSSSDPVDTLHVANASVNVDKSPSPSPMPHRMSRSGLTLEGGDSGTQKSSSLSLSHGDKTTVAMSDTKKNACGASEASSSMWVPLFPHSTSEKSRTNEPSPTGPTMDVSKLYAVCAAMSTV